MGKRELLLIGAFLLLGAGVYHVTAPPPKPGQEGFSLGRLVSWIRTEVQGENAEARVARTLAKPVDDGITRLVLPEFFGTLKVIGEDREDVSADLQAVAFGVDDTSARARAEEIQITLEPADDHLMLKVASPGMGRRPTNELTLRVPSRLACSLGFRGEAEIHDVAEVTFLASRGRVIMRDIGLVAGEYVNGSLELYGAREISLKTQRTEVRIERVAKTMSLEASRGSIRVRGVHGASTVRLERNDSEMEGLDAQATIRMEGGRLKLRGIVAPLEITGNRAGLELSMTTATNVSVSTTGDELAIDVPKTALTFDVRVEDGRILVPDERAFGVLKVKEGDRDQELAATIGSGGPTIRLRNEHADIIIRRAGERPESPERPEHPDRVEPPEPPEPPPPPPPGPTGPPRPEPRERREPREPRERPETPERLERLEPRGPRRP